MTIPTFLLLLLSFQELSHTFPIHHLNSSVFHLLEFRTHLYYLKLFVEKAMTLFPLIASTIQCLPAVSDSHSLHLTIRHGLEIILLNCPFASHCSLPLCFVPRMNYSCS
jgi:hypothetical protein